MNKYPAWLNVLVLVVLLAGILLAVPNIYGSVPAIQLADRLGEPITETQLREFVSTLQAADIEPEAAYLKHERAVIRFAAAKSQTDAGERLRNRGINIMKSVRRCPALSRVGASCHKGKPGKTPRAPQK